MKKYFSAYANDHFAKICQECQERPVLISKYNKPYVVMISHKEFKRLCKLTEDDWALLASTAIKEGFVDEQEIESWVNAADYDNLYFDKFKISKIAQTQIGELTYLELKRVIDALFDDKYSSQKLGNWHFNYVDIGKHRYVYDIYDGWYRLLYVGLKQRINCKI